MANSRMRNASADASQARPTEPQQGLFSVTPTHTHMILQATHTEWQTSNVITIDYPGVHSCLVRNSGVISNQ